MFGRKKRDKPEYEYGSKERREKTAADRYEEAKLWRMPRVEKWREYEDYYRGVHTTQNQLASKLAEQGIPFIPAVTQEPYIHTESQLQPEVPDFEFAGRDDDLDSQKAKQREYAVKFILQNNRIQDMNTRNERRLKKLGCAIWKAYWDGAVFVPGENKQGDVVIRDVGPECFFPDPTATRLEDCEFVTYVYWVHRNKALRTYREEIKASGLEEEALLEAGGNRSDTEIFEQESPTYFATDSLVQVMEHWFRHSKDGSAPFRWVDEQGMEHKSIGFESGDIGCTVLLNGHEVKYIPKYWIKTGAQNKRFPFVIYSELSDENSIWGQSEMEHIIQFTDSADREMAYAELNRAFTANDIMVVEENALIDGENLENRPGATVNVRAGKMGSVARLGGLNSAVQGYSNVEFLQSQIERVVGNFDSSQGQEPARVTTASGIAQLNERADARKNIKKADRLAGFERLFELIDWLALEFYDDGRLIFIGAGEEGAKERDKAALQELGGLPENMDPTQGSIFFRYRADDMRGVRSPAEYEISMDEEGNLVQNLVEPEQYYYPRVDATVRAGDGVRKSKAYTLSVLESLLQMGVTAENYKIAVMLLKVLEIPQAQELIEEWENRFEQQASEQIPGMQTAGSQPEGLQLPGLEGGDSAGQLPEMWLPSASTGLF